MFCGLYVIVGLLVQLLLVRMNLLDVLHAVILCFDINKKF